MKGRALRRALQTKDVIRINSDLPAITDETVFFTPELAQEMLQKNRHNRPVNWKKVEEYSDLMAAGQWALHSQGIILDSHGNILTGQTRLWAVVYSGVNVYMRVSRGNSPDVAKLLDRGRPQTARDLATRATEKRHSPVEASIARALCVLRGSLKPTTDEVAEAIAANANTAKLMIERTKGTKKTKGVLMILAAACEIQTEERRATAAMNVETLVSSLDSALSPARCENCWGRGAAFALAMEHARRIVTDF